MTVGVYRPTNRIDSKLSFIALLTIRVKQLSTESEDVGCTPSQHAVEAYDSYIYFYSDTEGLAFVCVND
jgi:hypothetical protein